MTENEGVKVNLEHFLAKFSIYQVYYVKLFALLIFSVVTNAFYSLNYIFATGDTTYNCKYSECSDSFITNLQNLTDLNRCVKHNFMKNNTVCSIQNLNTSEYTYCKEWVYMENKSFVEDFNLACQDWKRTLVGTVRSFGYMIGLLIIGPLADKFGRRNILIISGITAASMGLGKSMTTSYWIYIVLELVDALFGDTYSTSFILGVEMVTKEDRVLIVTVMTASTSIAGVVMAATAWSLPYWRHFLRAIYAPALFFIFYVFLLDESVRWLLIKGRKDEAISILKKAAKMCQIDIKECDLKHIDCDKSPSNTKFTSFMAMTITSKTLLMRFLACVLMWITGIFNKYTLLINSVELEGNKYLNFGLATLSELPASLVLAYVLKRFKRRAPLIGSFVLTGVFCVAQAVVPKGNPWISTSLFLAAKFMATISYATIYLYTSELFPTCTRNTMHALCSSLGRVASILAPQTPLLTRYWFGIPSVIVGGLSLFTGIVIILMPDTADDVLPNTVKEAEAIGTYAVSKADEVTKL